MLDIDANLLLIKTSALGSKAKRPMFSALHKKPMQLHSAKKPQMNADLIT